MSAMTASAVTSKYVEIEEILIDSEEEKMPEAEEVTVPVREENWPATFRKFAEDTIQEAFSGYRWLLLNRLNRPFCPKFQCTLCKTSFYDVNLFVNHVSSKGHVKKMYLGKTLQDKKDVIFSLLEIFKKCLEESQRALTQRYTFEEITKTVTKSLVKGTKELLRLLEKETNVQQVGNERSTKIQRHREAESPVTIPKLILRRLREKETDLQDAASEYYSMKIKRHRKSESRDIKGSNEHRRLLEKEETNLPQVGSDFVKVQRRCRSNSNRYNSHLKNLDENISTGDNLFWYRQFRDVFQKIQWAEQVSTESNQFRCKLCESNVVTCRLFVKHLVSKEHIQNLIAGIKDPEATEILFQHLAALEECHNFLMTVGNFPAALKQVEEFVGPKYFTTRDSCKQSVQKLQAYIKEHVERNMIQNIMQNNNDEYDG